MYNDPVAIDPALTNVLDIVVNNEYIACVNQLKITDIWKKVWLHQSGYQFFASVSARLSGT
jgi:hypothetical protein